MEEYIKWKCTYIKRYKKTEMVYVQQSKDNLLTTSEAHGYGMLLAIYNNDKETYIALLKFYLTRLNERGLMIYIILNEQYIDTSNKTSSDMDIAYSLLIAYEIWGDIDFKINALNSLNSIYNYNMNKYLNVPLLSDNTIDNVTCPGDFVLLYFEKFSKYHTIECDFWLKTRDTCISILLKFSKTKVGLISDYIVYNNIHKIWYSPKDKIVESSNDKNYFYNSCRVPLRLSEYYCVQQRNPSIVSMLKRYNNFFQKQKGNTSVGYKLNGSPIHSEMYDLAFTGPIYIMYTVLVESNLYNEKEKSRMDNVYSKLKIIQNNYYGDTIFLVGKYSIKYHKESKKEEKVEHQYNEMMLNIDKYTDDSSGILSNIFSRMDTRKTMYVDPQLNYSCEVMTKKKIHYGIIEIQCIGNIECYLLNSDNEKTGCLPIIYKMGRVLDTCINTYTLDWNEYKIHFFINKRLVSTIDNDSYKNPMNVVVSCKEESAVLSKMLIYEYKK